MKFLKFLFGFFLIGTFAVNTALPQAAVIKNESWVWQYCYSVQSHTLISPTGDIVARMTFQLDPGDDRIPQNGIKKYPVHAFYCFGGVWLKSLNEEMSVASNGKANGMFHFNVLETVPEPMAGAMLGGSW
jgi:hypothetical protein